MDKKLDQVMKSIAGMRERTTERGFTEAEAQEASAKMAELLLRHNLTLADVEFAAKGAGGGMSDDAIELYASRWKIDLLNQVAIAHGCKAIRLGGQSKKNHLNMVVVGYDHNLIVVRETYFWLQREIERLCRRSLKAAQGEGDVAALGYPGSWQRSFSRGAVAGIAASYSRMKARVREDVGEERWLPAVAQDQAVAAHYDELFPDSRSMGKAKKVLTDAYGTGVEEGGKIGLDRQVGGGAGAGKALAG